MNLMNNDSKTQKTLARALGMLKAGLEIDESSVRKEIMDSWRRCRDLFGHMEPVARQAPPDAANAHMDRELYAAGAPVMERYAGYVSADGGCLMLAAAGGRILHLAGNCDFLLNYGIKTGVDMSEDGAGTNAIALCLRSRSGQTICGAEHYAAALAGLACCAAPLSGGKYRFLGALCAAFPLEKWNQAWAALLKALGENINNSHHVNDLLHDQGTMLESLNNGVLILNRAGDIKAANSKARKMLNIESPEMVSLGHISRFAKNGAPFLGIIKKGTRIDDEEFSLDTGGVIKRVLLSASVIPADKGIVCSFGEMERMERLAARTAGAKAVYRFNDIIGRSEALIRSVELARMAAKSDITTLLLGESGSGKELFAHALHNSSSRARGPFITVNCGALPRELVQSELFGYAPGAFTGASKNGKPGKFELADKGTIFLDEIGEMPLDAQTSLLRLIQNREVSRVGSTTTRTVDVRIVAATNRNLQAAMESGAFRADLYYRLCVFMINVPSLRSRPEDIALLAEHFLRRYSGALGKSLHGFSPETIGILERYSWPGNIRELENIVEYAVNISSGPFIQTGDLPAALSGRRPQPTDNRHDTVDKYPSPDSPTLYQLERNAIVDALSRFNGNMSAAAHELGIARSALYAKLARFGIDHRSFRPGRR